MPTAPSRHAVLSPDTHNHADLDTGSAVPAGAALSAGVVLVTQASAELPCRVCDPELWFADNPSDLEVAKDLCLSCPVRAACLSGALERREPWGVWGGEIFEHGTVIARKRPRGRPRKEVAA